MFVCVLCLSVWSACVCVCVCVVHHCSDDVEMHIVPVIMGLAEPDSPDDFRADAVLASFYCFTFRIWQR